MVISDFKVFIVFSSRPAFPTGPSVWGGGGGGGNRLPVEVANTSYGTSTGPAS